MKKKLINKISKLILFLIYIILVISCFTSNRYEDFNFFEKIFSAPFCELTFWFSKIIDIKISFFITLIVGLSTLYPIFCNIFNNLKELCLVWKKIMIISKQKANTGEEQIAKTQTMLETYEKDGISFLNILVLIYCSFLGVFFLKNIFGGIFYSQLFVGANWKVLWFYLNSMDTYYILPSICFVLMIVFPIVKIIIKYKKSEQDCDRANCIVNTLMILAGTCLLVYPIVYSSIFAIFILLTYLFNLIKNIIKKIGDGKYVQILTNN